MNANRLLILVLILALAAPAMAGRFPVVWAGTWTVTEKQLECEGEGILDATERIVEMVGNDRDSDWDPELDFPSETSSFDDVTFNYIGSRTVVDGTCTIVTTVTYSLTRDGDGVVGLKQVEVIATGCEGSYCYEYQVSGNRSTAPVEGVTWSTVKSLYD